MKYLTEERFVVNSNDKESRRNYVDNYDRIFRQEEAPCRTRPGTNDIVHTDDCDGIECKVKMYANLIVPLEAQIGPIEEPPRRDDVLQVGWPCPVCHQNTVALIDYDKYTFECVAHTTPITQEHSINDIP